MSSQVSVVARQVVDGRRAETLERLLSAGAEELRSAGHEALTIRTVAARAGVSPATAYTYVASKNHLFAELFVRHLDGDPLCPAATDPARSPLDRLRAATRQMAESLAADPALAAAVTPALLSSDPDVERLRLRIGAEFLARFEAALAAEVDDTVLDALVLAFSGALLQAGMHLITYTDLADRLDGVVAVILEGHL